MPDVDLPDRDAPARLYARSAVRRLVAALDGRGETIRIVGGAVRNALIGRPVHEIDWATTALPETTIARARAAGLKPVPTGIEHGTITVVVDGEPFEVTTLREDVETDGRHAVVRFGRDFAADALRRDFTINALSVSPDGALHDVTGGLADLAARRVRFIGEARQRIREDYLRVLRFFRFHAEYADGPPDPAGLDAAIREREGLTRLSRERVGAEVRKLVAAPRAPQTAAAMQAAGILPLVLGGIGEPGRLTRVVTGDAALRLAALLVWTREDVERLRDRLRLSNAERATLEAYAAALARWHAAPSRDVAEVRRMAALFGVAVAGAAIDASGRAPDPEGGAALARLLSGAEAAPVFPLAGRDLLARGVPPGPALGRALAEARALWLAAGCPPDWSA